MIEEILIILACVPLYVTNSFCDKAISSKYEDCYTYIYNCIKFLICSLCIFPILFFDNSTKFGWGSLFCGIACGLMYAISKTIMLKGYERTSVAFMTLCHSSGMIIPCVIGALFWNEGLSVFAFVGIIMAVFSAVLLKGGEGKKKGYSVLGILIGIAVFATAAAL